MFIINKFKNGQNSFVEKNVTIDEILSTIKNGDENLNTITDLRLLGKSSKLYGELKVSKLPTFRFNFKFKDKASNDNITEPTGLMYLDVDGDINIDNTNPYIFASWKSLSETGLGILVKVHGLTKDNFKDNYIAISGKLGITVDMNACKATQQNILSFDKNLYENRNSITFQAKNKKVSSSVIKERERRIGLNDTFLKSNTIRFNNISDYFIDNKEEYIQFKVKEKICSPFIPKVIEEGNRNSTIYSIISNYALLNPIVGSEFLKAWADIINQHCAPRLSDSELSNIIKSVLKKRNENTLTPYFNKERRIIFNPITKLTIKEKQKTTAVLMGKFKTDKTQQTINDAIEDWDFEIDGIITQIKIATKISKSIATIKRNWNPFKEFVNELNNGFKEGLVDDSNISHYASDEALDGLKIESEVYNEHIEGNNSYHEIEKADGKICRNETNFFEVETTSKIEENEPFIYDVPLAKKFADEYISNLKTRRNKVIQLEIEKENEPENLIEILDNSPMKYVKKAYIRNDIDNGIITNLKQLQERIAS